MSSPLNLPSYSRLADIDGDGDVDLLIPGAVRWFENDSPTASSWSAHPLPKTIGDPTDVEATDFDGDGDLDVAAAIAGHGEAVAIASTSRPVASPSPLGGRRAATTNGAVAIASHLTRFSHSPPRAPPRIVRGT